MWTFWEETQFSHNLGDRRNYAETVPSHKFSIPGNYVKLRYFSQCKLSRVTWKRNKKAMSRSLFHFQTDETY